MLKVKDIFELEIAKFMYSYYHSKLPENFDNYFRYASKHDDQLIIKRDQLPQTIFIWNELKLETGNDLARTLE